MNYTIHLYILLLFLNHYSVRAVTCTINTFPYEFGGSNGDTAFNAFDMSANGEVAAGGTSSDSVIVGSGTFPIVVYYENTGTVRWSMKYTPIAGASATTTTIVGVYFSSST
jgi:hypothetical protein